MLPCSTEYRPPNPLQIGDRPGGALTYQRTHPFLHSHGISIIPLSWVIMIVSQAPMLAPRLMVGSSNSSYTRRATWHSVPCVSSFWICARKWHFPLSGGTTSDGILSPIVPLRWRDWCTGKRWRMCGLLCWRKEGVPCYTA